jgi:hypothetical protein
MQWRFFGHKILLDGNFKAKYSHMEYYDVGKKSIYLNDIGRAGRRSTSKPPHIMLRDSNLRYKKTVTGFRYHVDSENINLKIGHGSSLYQLFSKRDLK